jgi:hypothetical protein
MRENNNSKILIYEFESCSGEVYSKQHYVIKIIDYFKNSSVVIIGDLNTGPKIVDKNINAEFEGKVLYTKSDQS